MRMLIVTTLELLTGAGKAPGHVESSREASKGSGRLQGQSSMIMWRVPGQGRQQQPQKLFGAVEGQAVQAVRFQSQRAQVLRRSYPVKKSLFPSNKAPRDPSTTKSTKAGGMVPLNELALSQRPVS